MHTLHLKRRNIMQTFPQTGFLASIFGFFTSKPKPQPKINYDANYALHRLTEANAELVQYEPLLIEHGFIAQLTECKDKLRQFAAQIETYKFNEDFNDHFDEAAFNDLRLNTLPYLINEVRHYSHPGDSGMETIAYVTALNIDPMTDPDAWRKAAHVHIRDTIVATGDFTPETIGGRCRTKAADALGYVRQQHRLGLPL
ncbi:MAG: hypothetical protein EON60_09780 [Alphaproteobacteria bacterium]|nr:MAG: hypothetical protein EON60_09780 [Alphaproteobacteria bacterium]